MSSLRKLQLPRTIGEVLLIIFNSIFFIIFLYLFLHSLIDNGAPYLYFSIGKISLLIGIIFLTLLVISFIAAWMSNRAKIKYNQSESNEGKDKKKNPLLKGLLRRP